MPSTPNNRSTHTRKNITLGIGVGFAMLAASGCAPMDEPADTAQIVVTTNILTDVVQNIVGDQAEVAGLMPAGADPHSFQLSAQQSHLLEKTSLIIYNGLGLEGGLLNNVEAALDSGVTGLEVAAHVHPLPYAEDTPEHSHDHGEDNHHDHDHADEDHSHDENDEHEHSHVTDGNDPHFWNDPHRMMTAVELISEEIIAHVEGVNAEIIRSNTAAYLVQLEALDDYLHQEFDSIPSENRKLITNHAVFGYLAHAYHLEIIGTIIPGGTSLAEPSAAELSELVHLLEETGLGSIFAEVSQPQRLAETLATEVGHEVQVIALYSESLGEADSPATSYLDLMRYNGDQIVAALK